MLAVCNYVRYAQSNYNRVIYISTYRSIIVYNF